ncbi:hypothetical protein JCM10212_003020 [Sporobolomyces blumeae]
MADSPLSDADSLSSAGASTEPLPGSDPAPLSPPTRRTAGPASSSAKKAGGGNESDSSLTEQDSSDNERDEDDEDDEPRREPRRANGKLDRMDLDDDDDDDDDADEEEEDAEPTPKARPGQKRRAIQDDEEEDEEGDDVQGDDEDEGDDEARLAKSATTGNKLTQLTVMAMMKAGERGEGRRRERDAEDDPARTDDELEEVSDPSDDEQDRDHVPPAAKRPRRARSSTTGSVISSSTVNHRDGRDDSGRGSRAGSIANSLSDLEDDVVGAIIDDAKASAKGMSTATPDALGRAAAVVAEEAVATEDEQGDRTTATRAEAGGDEDEDEEEDGDAAMSGSDIPISKKAVAASARGGRGRVDAGEASARSVSPSARSDSPLSVVSSRDGLENDDVEATSRPQIVVEAEASADTDRDDLLATEDEKPPAKQNGSLKVKEEVGDAAATPASGRGRGRGRGGRGRARGKGRAAVAPSISRSNSVRCLDELPVAHLPQADRLLPASQTESSSEASGIKADFPLVNGNSSQAPDLPSPSGIVELDASEPAKLADQLTEIATGGKAGDELSQAADDEAREVVKKVAPPSAKKGGRKGGKRGGKGKEKAADQDATAEDEDGAAGESEHEEDTSDAAFMRKRSEAMEHLTKIEIQFAQLRDLLYVERMSEVEKDRIAIESGTHPELIHLSQLLELRRNKRLELAKAWLSGLEASYDRQYLSDEHAMWNRWQNQRADLRVEMLDDANTKRRKLEREKRALERPKDDTLAAILAPRPPPAVPLHERRRVGFDAEPLNESEIVWSLRNPDVRADSSLSGLEEMDAYADLERMGLREPLGPPGHFAYDGLYGPAAPHLSAYADPRTAHLASGYPYPYDSATIAMQSHAFGPPPAAGATAAAAAAPFGSLPRLPSREQAPSRPPSNPRANFPPELGGAPYAFAGVAAPSNRVYPYPGYSEGGPIDGAHGQHGSWPSRPAQVYGLEEEQRRRTPSAGNTLGSTESLDSIAGSRQSGGLGAGPLVDEPMSGARPADTAGRTTPVAGTNPKARLTLDDHMSYRSPKSTTSAAKAAERASSGRNSPSSFMAIPTIPPFDRYRHEKAVAARANSPHPAPLATLSSNPPQPSSLFSQSSASTPATQPDHLGQPTSSTAQRAA